MTRIWRTNGETAAPKPVQPPLLSLAEYHATAINAVLLFVCAMLLALAYTLWWPLLIPATVAGVAAAWRLCDPGEPT